MRKRIFRFYVNLGLLLLLLGTSIGAEAYDGIEPEDESFINALIERIANKISTPVKEMIKKDTTSLKAKAKLQMIQDSLYSWADSIAKPEIKNLKYFRESTPVVTMVAEEGGATIDSSFRYWIDIKGIDTAVRNDIMWILEGVEHITSEDKLMRSFIDAPDGRFLMNTSNRLVGLVPPRICQDGEPSKYMKVFNDIFQKAKKYPDSLMFVSYTFYDIDNNERVNDSYAWIVYDQKLDWLIGVAIGAVYYSLDKKEHRDTLVKRLIIIGGLAFILCIGLLSYLLGKKAKKILEKNKKEVLNLSERKERFFVAAQHASSYIALIDNHDVIQWCNKSFKAQYQKGEGNNRPIFGTDFFSWTNHPEPDKLKKEIQYKRRNPTENDPITYFSYLGDRAVQSVLTFFPKGSLNHGWFILVDTDIEAQQNIFKAISHDILSPLLNSKSTLRKLSAKLNGSELHRSDVNKLITNIEESYNTVKNFRDTTRFEMQIDEFHPQPISLHDEVNNAVILLESFAESCNTRIENNIDPLIEVYADKNMLTSIFRNLISNALKSINVLSTPREGKIVIEATVKNQIVNISISDNGKGMTTVKVDQLFDKATIDSGLGTYLVKFFLNAHGKHLKIKVKSKEHAGTSIYFQLPNYQYVNNSAHYR